MSGWGAYFSYAKKKPLEVTPTPTDALPLKAEETVLIKPYIPDYGAAKKPTDGFQRANSSAKKLYDVPAEPVKDVVVQRSDSNAARMAKMFGYTSTPAPAAPVLSIEPLDVTAPVKVEQKSVEPKLAAVTPVAIAKEPVASKMSTVVSAAIIQAKKDPTITPATMKPKKDEVQDMLDLFASQADKPDEKVSAPVQSEDKEPKAIPQEQNTPRALVRRHKSNTSDMLDFFASQFDNPVESIAPLIKNEISDPKAIVQADVIPRPIVRRHKSKASDMLDFFASQLDTPAETFVQPAVSEDRQPKALMEEAFVRRPKIQHTSKTSDMLDFFASQLDTPIEYQGPTNEKKVRAVRAMVHENITTRPVARNKPKAADMLDLLATQLDTVDIVSALPSDKTMFSDPFFQDKPEMNKSPTDDGQYSQRQFIKGKPPITRKDSIWSRQSSSTSSELSMAMNKRSDSIWSRQGSVSSTASSVFSGNTSARTSQSEQDVREKLLTLDETEEQLKLERTRQKAEHEHMLELEKHYEQIRTEREEMDAERNRMLKEQMMFEEEADRIAEEAESMRKFVESVERERELDIQNEDKKRRRREAELEAQRRADNKEQERVEAEVRRAREAELAAELEAERAEREAERAAREIEKERKRVEDMKRNEVEMEKQRVEDRERRQYEAKEDRLAKEEADRMTAELQRYEEEKEAERRLIEDEEERRRASRDRKRRAAQEKEEMLRYEQAELAAQAFEEQRTSKEQRRVEKLRYEQAELEAQAFEEERIDKEQRHMAKQQADRWWKKEERSRNLGADLLANDYMLGLDARPLPSPSIYEEDVANEEYNDEAPEDTKEDKLRKAEEKIRLAFAGLAEQRSQQSSAALPRSNTVRGDEWAMRPAGNSSSAIMDYGSSDRGVSRYNTTGGARLQNRDGPQTPAKGARAGGLPSGPRRGGLPGGPRPVRR